MRVKLADILGTKEGRRAAAPVKLLRYSFGVDQRGHPVDLLEQDAQILGGLGVIARRHHVAAAVIAQRVAERDVRIQRQVAPAILGLADFLQPFLLAKTFGKIGRGRIGGIARAGLAVFLQEFDGELHGVKWRRDAEAGMDLL